MKMMRLFLLVCVAALLVSPVTAHAKTRVNFFFNFVEALPFFAPPPPPPVYVVPAPPPPCYVPYGVPCPPPGYYYYTGPEVYVAHPCCPHCH